MMGHHIHRTLLITTGCFVILASGLAHGLLTNRWGNSKTLEVAAARLRQCPLQIGEWRGTELEVSDRQLKQAEIQGYISRQYTNTQTGDACNVLLVCGRPGPISVHTPDVCLQGSGFRLVSAAKRTTESVGDSLWVGDFVPPSSGLGGMRVFWGWGTGDGWTSPDNPRLQFAAQPYLYKIYVTRNVARAGDPIDDDVCLRFLRTFQPAFQHATRATAELATN